MAEKTFVINTEPHVATIGNDQLAFLPEVIGAAFAEGYAKLVEVQKRVGGKTTKPSSTKHAKVEDVDPETLAELNDAMRTFLRGLMMPDSQKLFDAM